MWDKLAGAIQRLPDIERLVFTLYYYEELTTEEIEFLLGETELRISEIHASALLLLHNSLAEAERMSNQIFPSKGRLMF
jgi:RNA polymerase sigma factor for flagellar operon FliA